MRNVNNVSVLNYVYICSGFVSTICKLLIFWVFQHEEVEKRLRNDPAAGYPSVCVFHTCLCIQSR